LVRSLESSAAETIAKIYPTAKKYGVSLVYNRGSTDGFPTSAPLTTRLTAITQDDGKGRMGPQLHVSDDLDGALVWAEDQLLAAARRDGRLKQVRKCSKSMSGDALQQVHALCPEENIEVVRRLLCRMTRREVEKDTVLWKQGTDSAECLLLSEGLLERELEEEAGTVEECTPGCFIGEYTFLRKEKHMGTVRAKKRSVVYSLSAKDFEDMIRSDAYLALVLANITIRNLGIRCCHVANRIWDTHCVPI